MLLRNRSAISSVAALAILFASATMAVAQVTLTTTPVTWNVIGLDSNKPSTDGPYRYLIGTRVRNTGATTATNLSSTLTWDAAAFYQPPNGNIPGSPPTTAIVLEGPDTITWPSLAPNEFIDFYYLVNVGRAASSHYAARRYRITTTADGLGSPIVTPTPRQVFVEKFVSQNRNTVTSLTGPTQVFVGRRYDYRLLTDTSTNGYEQLVSTVDFPNTLFQIRSVATTYTAPTGGTNDKIYADACGWDNVPTSNNYNKCIGPVNWTGGKVGGIVTTDYNIQIISTTAPNITVIPVIYDYSGSSFHYNTDYGASATIISNLDPDIGGRVYRDLDADGIFDNSTGETGFAGVVVRLYTAGPNGTFGNPDDVLIATATTNSQGIWFFNTVPNGTYQTRLDTTTAPAGLNQVSGLTNHTVIVNDANINNLDTGYNNGPLYVDLNYVMASFNQDTQEMGLRWETNNELANVGFHIYRATQVGESWEKGERLTANMIPPAAPDGEGAAYSFVDQAPLTSDEQLRGYFLEDTDFSGLASVHGPYFWVRTNPSFASGSTTKDWKQY